MGYIFLAIILASVSANTWVFNGEHNEANLTRHVHTDQICDTVAQASGYFNIDAKTDKHYFYWAFDSRTNPSNDPVVLWMTGGPGCSSEMALFRENGPCTINDDLSTSINEFSWNTEANLIFIDQPAGTGFSYADKAGYDSNEAEVGEDMYQFLQMFFESEERWQSNEFYVFGESYGGHFVPAVSHRVWLGNQNKEGIPINLQGVGIGNGLTNPEVQYAWYPEYTYNFTKEKLGKPVITEEAYAKMKSQVPSCIKQIKNCQTGSDLACKLAQSTCNNNMMGPYAATGLNSYDIREPCAVPPLCYDFSNIDKYLAQPKVLEALGIDADKSEWSQCNFDVNSQFSADWMHNFHTLIPDMLGSNITFLIYAGDCDFVCNWVGNKEWTKALEWSGKEEYNNADDRDWMYGTKKVGEARTARGLTFLKVLDAGHMVPMDQPEYSLEMLKRFIRGDPFGQ